MKPSYIPAECTLPNGVVINVISKTIRNGRNSIDLDKTSKTISITFATGSGQGAAIYINFKDQPSIGDYKMIITGDPGWGTLQFDGSNIQSYKGLELLFTKEISSKVSIFFNTNYPNLKMFASVAQDVESINFRMPCLKGIIYVLTMRNLKTMSCASSIPSGNKFMTVVRILNDYLPNKNGSKTLYVAAQRLITSGFGEYVK